MSILGLSPPLKCEDKDAVIYLDGLESQEVGASSEVYVCLLVLSFYLAMCNADMKLEIEVCDI